MPSGITNAGKSRLFTANGWSGALEVELVTESYSAIQIRTLTRSGLTTATGGNYAAYNGFVVISASSSNLPNFYNLQISPDSIVWDNLSTDGTAPIKGFALCQGSDVLLVQDLPEYMPNGSDYSITLVGSTIARFNLSPDQYISDVIIQNAANLSYDFLTEEIQARLVTFTANPYSNNLGSFTFASGGNYTDWTITGKSIITNGGRITFDADNPFWLDLTTNGTPIIGVAFTIGGRVLCYHELETSFIPNGTTATYVLPTNGILYLGDV